MIEKRVKAIFMMLLVAMSCMAMGCLGDDDKQVVAQPENVTYVQSAPAQVYHDDSNFWETMYLANLIGGNSHTREVHYVHDSPSYSTPKATTVNNNYYSGGASQTKVKDVKAPMTSGIKPTTYKTNSYSSYKSTTSYKPASSTRTYSSYSSGSSGRSYSSSGFRSSSSGFRSSRR